MCSKVWYIRAVQTDNNATTMTTMAAECLRRYIACKAICATRALHRYEPGKSLISVDILAVQARTNSQSWDRRVILERPFTVSFRQDMACPDDPRLPQTTQIFQTRPENVDLSSEWHYRVFLSLLWSRCTHNFDICIICVVAPRLDTHNGYLLSNLR